MFSNQNILEMAKQFQLSQLNVYQNSQPNILNDIQQFTNSLSQEDLKNLYMSSSFINARSTYESAFIDYLGGLHAVNFISTPTGQQVAESLLKVMKDVSAEVKANELKEKEKLSKLAKLLEENPELLKQLENGQT